MTRPLCVVLQPAHRVVVPETVRYPQLVLALPLRELPGGTGLRVFLYPDLQHTHAGIDLEDNDDGSDDDNSTTQPHRVTRSSSICPRF